mmetsp:Transcript_1906/g.6988  ORF Transcript_1906/g.6988 Transcript_1906/m.6988 type:complete len:760 (+) Transcript_1906:3-2282(+)
MPRYVVGVDGGTESLRAGVFSEDGSLVASHASAYKTSFPKPGWAEQEPSDWWRALGEAVRGALEAAPGVAASDVAAVCVDTTCCSVVALDSAGDALRPSLLWMDMRSTEEAEMVAACGDPALRVNCAGAGPVSAEWMIPKALWLKRHEPEVFDRAAYVCEMQDYLNFHLTGGAEMVASANNVAVRWHFGAGPEAGPPLSMLSALGLDALAGKWPQEVLPLGASIGGGLSEGAAAHLGGLAPGTIVAQGGADAFIGMIGLGCISPGQLALLTGSSHLHLGVTAGAGSAAGLFGTYRDGLLPGTHIIEGGQTSTGSVVSWFKREMLGGRVSYEELNAEAEAVQIGCEGLEALEHFQGNRTPYVDGRSRGALAGLTLRHSRGHVFRALLEGVCFGTELILERMRDEGFAFQEVVIAGGATRSPLWLQMHADVIGLPLVMTRGADNACALGCAVLAAFAAGWYPSVPDAVKAMVHTEHTIQPSKAAHAAYRAAYKRYASLYPALTDVFRSAAEEGTSASTDAEEQARGREQPRVLVAASILAADACDLGREAENVLANGADWIHIDVTDGEFAAPCLTFGLPTIAALRKRLGSNAFLDVHVAAADPRRWIEPLANAGASQLTFHLEAAGAGEDARAIAADVRTARLRAGVALAPATPVDPLLPLVRDGALDCVDVLAVEPGAGGQAFNAVALEKIRALRTAADEAAAAGRTRALVQVDGGVKPGNGGSAELAREAGADVVVAGTALFGARDRAKAISGLKGKV